MGKKQNPGEKCGNCAFFAVRNQAEVELARIAKTEAECRPGEWVFEGKRKVGCHGGPVRGMCAKWRERGAQVPAMMSTQWCPLWSPGGAVIRQAGGSPNEGSPNRISDKVPEGAHSTLLAMGAVAAAGVISELWNRWRG
jgi:hypothetical protein